MSIANNELWVRTFDHTLIESIDTIEFNETLISARLTDDGWTVFTFDSDITKIGDYALSAPYSNISGYEWVISEIIIPASVTSIGTEAFTCSCARVYMNSLTPPKFNSSFLIGSLGTVYYPIGGDKSSWKNAVGYACCYYETDDFTDLNNFNYIKTQWVQGYSPNSSKSGDDILELYLDYDGWYYMTYPLTHTEVDDELFKNYHTGGYSANITKVHISDGFTSIGNSSFASCRYLEEVLLPNTLVSIGDYAFSYVYNIDGGKSGVLNIPDSVTSIGQYAFQNTKFFDEIIFGKGLQTIGMHAFWSAKIKVIYSYPSTAPTIDMLTFRDVPINGTVYYPVGADYSSWFVRTGVSLADYNWVKYGLEVDEEGKFIFPSISIDPTEINAGTEFISNYPITVIAAGHISVHGNPDWFPYLGMGDTTDKCYFNINENTGRPRSTVVEFKATSGDCYKTVQLAVNQEGFELFVDLNGTFKEEEEYTFTITYNPAKPYTIDAPEEFTFNLVSDVDNGDGSSTATYTFVIDELYSDSTATITISDGSQTIERTINIIAKEEEPDMPTPSITISSISSNVLPASGGSINVTVTYNNTTQSRVNEPVTSTYGVEITETGYTTGETSYTSMMTITVPSSTYTKDIAVVFSCIGIDGSSCTESLTITLEATRNGITLSNYSGVYAATGESKYNTFRIILHDYDGNTNLYDNVTRSHYGVTSDGMLTPAEWFTSSTGDGKDYIDVRVTVANGFEEPRLGVIVLDYVDKQGGSYSAEYTVIQKGADGEPLDILEPEVQPYVSQVKVDAEGNNALQTNYNTIQVNYQDLSGGTINSPRINADWFRITNSQITRNDEDGVLYAYTWECDENTDYDARQTTVEFSANLNNITYTASTVIMQASKDDSDDSDDQDIPVIEGVYIGQIWKDVEFVFGNQDVVNYSVYYGDTCIFTGKSWKRPNAVQNKIMVNKICQNYLIQGYLDLETTGWEINNYDFTVRSVDGSTVYATFRFVNDWSYSDYFKTGWLYHPILENQIGVRGQMFPFSLFGAGEQVSLEYGVEYKDGYKDSYGKPVEDWWSTEYMTNGVCTDFFKVALRDADYIDTVWIDTKKYKLKESCEIPYVMYYLNPWGGYDWFPIRGRVDIIDKTTPYSYTKNYNNTTIGFGHSRYLSEISREYRINTGWLKQVEADRMWYLLQSNVVYLHDLKENKIYPVIIKDTEIERKQKTRTEKILNYQFTVEFSQTRERL